jgi:outer membrane protein
MHWYSNTIWIGLFLVLINLGAALFTDAHKAQAQALKNASATTEPSLAVMSLTDVIDLALRDNRGLISSAYRVQIQELSKDIAQSEFEWKLFPTAEAATTDAESIIGGGLKVEKKFTPGLIASAGPSLTRSYAGDNTPGTSSQWDVSLTTPLLRGFGTEINTDRVLQARYAFRTAARSHYLVKVNTVLEAVTTTYTIVEQRELVRLYHNQVERFQQHAVKAQAKEKIGLASPIDVYRAEIRLKDAQDSLNRAQQALRNAADRLKVILARPLEQAMQVVAPLMYRPLDIGITAAVQTAMNYRVELKQVDDDIQEAKRASRFSKNNMLPQLDLVANYSHLKRDDFSGSLTSPTEDLWSINLVTTTDWSRTAEKAAYQQSLLGIKQVELNRPAREDNIKREVRQFYDAVLKAQDRIQIRNEQINQAEGKLALAKIKFGLGMANNFDLIEAETELQDARANLLAAQIDYIVGTYRLRAAMGTLVEA